MVELSIDWEVCCLLFYQMKICIHVDNNHGYSLYWEDRSIADKILLRFLTIFQISNWSTLKKRELFWVFWGRLFSQKYNFLFAVSIEAQTSLHYCKQFLSSAFVSFSEFWFSFYIYDSGIFSVLTFLACVKRMNTGWLESFQEWQDTGIFSKQNT